MRRCCKYEVGSCSSSWERLWYLKYGCCFVPVYVLYMICLLDSLLFEDRMLLGHRVIDTSMCVACSTTIHKNEISGRLLAALQCAQVESMVVVSMKCAWFSVIVVMTRCLSVTVISSRRKHCLWVSKHTASTQWASIEDWTSRSKVYHQAFIQVSRSIFESRTNSVAKAHQLKQCITQTRYMYDLQLYWSTCWHTQGSWSLCRHMRSTNYQHSAHWVSDYTQELWCCLWHAETLLL